MVLHLHAAQVTELRHERMLMDTVQFEPPFHIPPALLRSDSMPRRQHVHLVSSESQCVRHVLAMKVVRPRVMRWIQIIQHQNFHAFTTVASHHCHEPQQECTKNLRSRHIAGNRTNTLRLQIPQYHPLPMTDANVQVRRATIEDIPQLISLCQQEGITPVDFEKRFKEFQVVQGSGGEVLGTIGLQISGNHGLLHTEAIRHPEQADAARQKLWDRIALMSQNFGLVRLWIQTGAPFWHSIGFVPATAEVMPKLPSEFSGSPGNWSTLQLKEETAPVTSLDKEFAVFREAERERTEKLFRQARVLKMVAGVIAVAVFALVAVWAFLFFKNYKGQRTPR